jgi:hypothetical protein
VVLEFDKSGSGDASDYDLSHRYLWGPAVDQLLADEQVDLSGEEAETPVQLPINQSRRAGNSTR